MTTEYMNLLLGICVYIIRVINLANALLNLQTCKPIPNEISEPNILYKVM